MEEKFETKKIAAIVLGILMLFLAIMWLMTSYAPRPADIGFNDTGSPIWNEMACQTIMLSHNVTSGAPNYSCSAGTCVCHFLVAR